MIILETSLSAESLFVANTQLDIREERSNAGPEVARYLRSVNLPVGHPWCMAFVYWCVQVAADRLKLENPLVRTAGVLRQWNECTCRKIPGRSGAVKPGDIFIMDFGGGKGHTGFVTGVKPGIIETIEGNTNDEGSREGVEVCRRERPISSIKGFIQLP